MELDLHGYTKDEAFIEVIYSIKECLGSGETEISIIHGYHTGTILKNYFNSIQFIKDIKKAGFSLKKGGHPNLGQTTFRIL